MKYLFVFLLLCFVFSCIPVIESPNYHVFVLHEAGALIREFYAESFWCDGDMYSFNKVSTDNLKHYFVKSQSIIIEIIKLR